MLNSKSLLNLNASLLAHLADRRDATTETLNTFGEQSRKVAGGVEAVMVKEQSIAESRVLNDVGKSQALVELATAAASKFTWLSRVVGQLEDDIRDTKKTLYAVKPPRMVGEDPVVQFLAGKEMRDRYRGLDQRERDMAFLRAADVSDTDELAQANRDAILWAIQETPGGPMITPDILRRALEERARHQNPETVNRLTQVEILREHAHILLDSVRLWLSGLGGNPDVIYKELGGSEPTVTPIEQAARQRELVR